MFDLIRFNCERILGSSLSLSHECFNYISSNLHAIVIQLVQQSFLITLRSKRTRLLGDDLQLMFKCRGIFPLYGYCCSMTTDKLQLFETTRQFGRILFIRADFPINLNEKYLAEKNDFYQSKKLPIASIRKEVVVSCSDIFLHVEWLAINGEQRSSRTKSPLLNKFILNSEQNLYLLLLQSKNFNEEVWHFLRNDQMALNAILSNLIKWCRDNICECLIHSFRFKKRCQLASYLTILNCLLENPLITINHYLHILSPIIMSCLLYEFEISEPLDYNETDKKSAVETGHTWSLRLIASQACAKMLQRSNVLIYDIFYTRIISQLIYSLTNTNTPLSAMYAILSVFEQLGSYNCRTFLLPHLLKMDLTKIFSSKSTIEILEQITMIIIKK